ncbi:MAG: DegV family protein [Deltaproteobacteria bacterium]|nr:DegV family protein [Deltaproteobacteria bacterium]
MDALLQDAHVTGLERVAAWADLLDQINVFPVADGDTGRNLLTTLSPLRELERGRDHTVKRLLLSARGNSGNIAALFFSGLLSASSVEMLHEAAQMGKEKAWQAIADPVSGTMLDVMDALAEAMKAWPVNAHKEDAARITDRLAEVVRETRDRLPKLKEAGVVDAGALGIYIFLEGFFRRMAGTTDQFQPVTDAFEGLLQVSPAFSGGREDGYCVDMVVRFDETSASELERLSEHGESVVVIPHEGVYKVHLHTRDRREAKTGIESLCHIIDWSEDDLGEQTARFKGADSDRCIHIMTDAAGSIPRDTSRDLGITLLNSYITAGNLCLPETLFQPQHLYETMRSGTRVSSSQASVFERHQHYESALSRYNRVLYLCVGSFYTGNFDVAVKWKEAYDTSDRFTVIDTGAASGRLGLLAIAAHRFATQTEDPDAVVAFSRAAVDTCEEYVFLDRLHYLAAGGRLSKSSAFFGICST